MNTLHDPEGELAIQWSAYDNPSDDGFSVVAIIGGRTYRASVDPHEKGPSRDRMIRNILVSSFEHELSSRFGLLPKDDMRRSK